MFYSSGRDKVQKSNNTKFAGREIMLNFIVGVQRVCGRPITCYVQPIYMTLQYDVVTCKIEG